MIEGFSLFLLSFFWSFYFFREIFNGRKKLKYYLSLKESIPDFKWSIQMKNCQIQQIRDRFLLIICVLECTIILVISLIISLNTILYDGTNMSFDFGFHHEVILQYIKYLKLLITSENYLIFGFSVVLTVLLSIYMFSRILTEYMCSCYSFYSVQAHNKTKILRSLYILTVLFIVGLIPHLQIIYYVSYIACMTFEFLKIVKATKRLRRFLYQRYFDSYTFENQNKSIVKYYKGAYRHFTIASYLLLSSLFLHILSLSIFLIHPILMCVLYYPFNFPTIILSGGKYTPVYNDSPIKISVEYSEIIYFYDTIVNLIELIILVLGWAILIIPYTVITINGVSSKVLAIWRKQKPITINRN